MSSEQKSGRPDNSEEAPSPFPFTLGSLFAGIGGFCLAFKSAGFEVLWANEVDSFATLTYKYNLPGVRLIEKGIQTLSVNQDGLSEVDVLTAGFPCQPFSVAGPKTGFSDQRGRLFFEITRLLKEFKDRRPKIVILENVKHLLRHDKGRTFAKMSSELQLAGYWFRTTNAAVLNTMLHTRIPQNRERLFMVAFNWDIYPKNDFAFPEIEDGVDPIEGLLHLDEKAADDLYFGEESKYGRMFAESMAKGGKNSVYILRRYYVRENKSNSVFTLTANMGDGGHNVPVIKDRWGIRKLTPMECARLQGFEEPDFHFPDELSKTQRYKQIGNSVTVPLVKKLAMECKRHLSSLAHACRRSL